MVEPARFSYSTIIDPTGAPLLRPIISIGLALDERQIIADALVDSGADANVLPYQLGLDLGANWGAARPVPTLSGSIGQTEARAIALQLTIAPFYPVWAVFIWVRTDTARLLLGQINFFQEFNVCFFGAAGYFEISPKDH